MPCNTTKIKIKNFDEKPLEIANHPRYDNRISHDDYRYRLIFFARILRYTDNKSLQVGLYYA